MTILSDIKHILHLLIIFQCFILATFLLTHQSHNKKANRILAIFLLAKGIAEFGGFYRFFPELFNLLYAHTPHLLYFNIPFTFVVVPALFLYTQAMTDQSFTFRRSMLWHGLPFAICLVILLAQYHIHTPDTLRRIIDEDGPFKGMPWYYMNWISDIQFLVYAVLSLRLLARYRQNLKTFYSEIGKINLSWLSFLLLGFMGWKSLGLTQSVLWITSQSGCAIFLYIGAELLFLIFVSLMVLMGMKQPRIFDGQQPELKPKYEKTLLPDEARDRYKEKLIRCMTTDKPHLDPCLNINDLSSRVAIPPAHISQVINGSLGQNFFDFVNGYRIEECKRMLSDESANRKTLLEVLLDAGFNSKSVFNTAFKKHTGMTPSQFRKQQIAA